MKPRYVGIAEEATFKTPVGPTKYLDVADESIEADQGWIVPPRCYSRSRRKAKLGKYLTSGRISLGAIEPENIGELLKWLLGTASTVHNLAKAGGGSTTLSAGVAAGVSEIPVVAVTNLAVDDYIQIGTSDTAECRKITLIVTLTLTLDKPIAFAHASGEAVVESDDAKGFTHTIKGADDLKSFTMNVGHDTDAIKHPGCIVDSGTIRVEDEFLDAVFEVLVGALAVNDAIVPGAVVSELPPFAFHEGALKIPKGGSALDDWQSFEATVRNNLVRDRRTGGSRFLSRIMLGERIIEGSVVIDFTDLNEFDTFIAGTETSLDLKFTGGLIATGYNYEFEIELPRIFYVTDCSPHIRRREPESVTCGFWALYDVSSGYDVKVTLKNKQAYLL